MKPQKLEGIEDGTGNDSDSGSGDGPGNGTGAVDWRKFGTDARAAGSGDGAIVGGSRGSSGDGGSGGDDSGDGPTERLRGSERTSGDSDGVSAVSGGNDGIHAEPRKRGRPRKHGGRGRSGDSDRAAGSGGESEKQQSTDADNVRGVRQGKPKDVKDSIFEDGPKLNKSGRAEMIAAVLQGIFFLPAQILGPEHGFWKLSNAEAKELAEAVLDVIGTLTPKEQKQFEKFMAEKGPYIKLAVVGGSIFWGRAARSLEVEKAKRAKNADLEFRTSAGNGNPFANPGAYGTGPVN